MNRVQSTIHWSRYNTKTLMDSNSWRGSIKYHGLLTRRIYSTVALKETLYSLSLRSYINQPMFFWILASSLTKKWTFCVFFNPWPGKSLYRGKGMVSDVQLSTNYRLDWFWIMKNIFQWSNSQFYSWLTTAHPLPPV